MRDNQVVIKTDTLESNLVKSLEAPKLDPIYLSIANDHMSGISVEDLSNMYDISQDLVTSIIAKKEVENYINGVLLTQGYVHRNKRLALINKVIDKKLEEAEETGVLSKKDLLDWLKHLKDEETSIRPKEKQGPAVAIQVNNYDKLMNDLLTD